MSNFWKTMRFSIIVFSFFYGCVGPPEPDHGLIENKPVVVNDLSAFSFLMRNDRHTFEEEYNFNFSNIFSSNFVFLSKSFFLKLSKFFLRSFILCIF